MADRPEPGGANPVAAIVITTYNYASFLADAVDSALAQTVPCQVIVVDDGSTDETAEVLDRYQADASTAARVEVLTKANGGQASAINVGWAAVRAPLVIFLDGDDALHADAVATVATAFAADPTATKCQFRLDHIDEAGDRIDGGFPEQHRTLPVGDLRSTMAINPGDIAWQPTTGNAFRAATLHQILPMPEAPYRISADHYLSNISALYGPQLAVERVLGHYRIHGANADHREGFDLERARSILRRTVVTNRLLVDHAASIGLAFPSDPARLRSIAETGQRLVSLRLDPAGHPFPSDRRSRLLGRGLRAVAGRGDLSVVRRAAAVVWLATLVAAPRPMLDRLVTAALRR